MARAGQGARCALGVEGIKADDGEGYYFPDDVRFADGSTGADAAWRAGGLYRRSMQRALDEVHPGRGVLFGRSGWTGQQATGMLWGGDQASDFWSLRVLVAATITRRRERLLELVARRRRLPRPPPRRALPAGAARALGAARLLHAAHAGARAAWSRSRGPTTSARCDIYRAYVLLHEQLVPYVRAAAATAARSGLPIIRPLHLTDPGDDRGWTIADAYGFGPALWVAPVLEEGAREREVALPRGDWIEAWSGERVRGGGEVLAPAPREHDPGLGAQRLDRRDVPRRARRARARRHARGASARCEATLWGEPRLGHAARPARRRHEDRVAARALVGRPRARRDVQRALLIANRPDLQATSNRFAADGDRADVEFVFEQRHEWMSRNDVLEHGETLLVVLEA